MKISDSVEMIDGTMAHTYVVRHEGKVVLIDTGMKSSGKRIIQYFEEHSEKPDIILITHYHPDHIGGLSTICEKYKPSVYAPREELEVIRGQKKPIPAKSVMSKFVSAVSRSGAVENVSGLDELSLDWMKVVETRGHTPGSASFLFEPESFLFVGDAVTVKNQEASVNRQFSLDLEEAEKSRKKILSMSGVTILPGHGDPLRIQ